MKVHPGIAGVSLKGRPILGHGQKTIDSQQVLGHFIIQLIKYDKRAWHLILVNTLMKVFYISPGAL